MSSRKTNFELFPKNFGVLPYVFLVYLTFPAYYISLENGWKMVIGFILLFVFLVAYRQLYMEMGERSYSFWLVVQLVIILYLSIFYNFYNWFMGFFPANFIGWYTNKKHFYRALVLFGIVMLIPFGFHFMSSAFSKDIFYLLPFLIIMLASPFGIRSMNAKMELEKKLDEANEQIKEYIKREERMRIARDLHDTLGHTMSLITLKSQLISKLIPKDSKKALEQTKELEKTSRAVLTQLRELVSDMRAITVAEELIEARTILKAAGIALHFQGDSELKRIPFLTQNILSMCLREGVTNVVKHSHADHCYVTIEEEEGQVLLTIQDDGIGRIDGHYGNGLNGMSERLELIDGSLQLSSHNGMKLMIMVPIIIKESEASGA